MGEPRGRGHRGRATLLHGSRFFRAAYRVHCIQALGAMGRGASRAHTFMKYAFISSSSCSAVRGFSLAPRPLPPPLLAPRPPRPWPPLPLGRAQVWLRQPGTLYAVLDALLRYDVKERNRRRGTCTAIEALTGCAGARGMDALRRLLWR